MENKFNFEMQLKVAKDTMPLRVEEYRNSVMERKIKKSEKLLKSVESRLTTLLGMIEDRTLKAFRQMNALCGKTITDDDRRREAVLISRQLNVCGQYLENIESTISKPKEMHRQLSQKKAYLEADLLAPELQGDNLNIDKFSKRFMLRLYIASIDDIGERVDDAVKQLGVNRAQIEKILSDLNSAIPATDDIESFTIISHKLQDVLNRMNIACEQNHLSTKDNMLKISAISAGINALIETYKAGKDLYLRNNLVGAMFGAVETLYNVTDNKMPSVRVSIITYVKDSMIEYSKLCSAFEKGMMNFRKYGDETMKHIAIILGKPISSETLDEIYNITHDYTKSVSASIESLIANNSKQIDVLQGVLNI